MLTASITAETPIRISSDFIIFGLLSRKNKILRFGSTSAPSLGCGHSGKKRARDFRSTDVAVTLDHPVSIEVVRHVRLKRIVRPGRQERHTLRFIRLLRAVAA